MLLALAGHHATTANQSAGFHLTPTQVAIGAPIGLIIAALISFLALRWSTNKTIKSQSDALEKTLENEKYALEATLATQLQNTQMTLENDRLLAVADRTWQARRKVYERLIRVTRSIMETFTINIGYVPGMDALRSVYQPLRDCEDKVVAYASDEVMASANQLNMSVQKTIMNFSEIWTEPIQGNPDSAHEMMEFMRLHRGDEIDGWLAGVGNQAAALIQLVRSELSPTKSP